MRFLPIFSLALAPFAAQADSFDASSRIVSAELYTRGALIQREVTVELPAGAHKVVVDDLPLTIPLETVRVALEGAALGSVTMRREAVPPRDVSEDPALIAAEKRIEDAMEALRVVRQDRDGALIAARAAQARIDFLNRLGTVPMNELPVADMAGLVGTIGSETENALKIIAEANAAARAFDEPLKDAQEELDKAQRARDALVPEASERALATLDVQAEAETTAVIRMSYFMPNAGWAPVYNFHLSRDEDSLRIERGAVISQRTGENWDGVAVSLTTRQPTTQMAPSELYPELRRIDDEATVYGRSSAKFEADVVAEVALADTASRRVSTPPPQIMDGISVTYDYEPLVTLASGADEVRIALGDMTTDAEVYARAVPARDKVAFLMADADNTSGEIILPSQQSRFFLDGALVGLTHTELYAAGSEMTLAFGPIEGIRLTQLREDRQEGDRGIISRTNQLEYQVTYEVENLTGLDWPLRVVAQVPYTEQEDLRLSWDASPRPDVTDPEGKKGLMEWQSTIEAGNIERFGLSYRLSWPDGQVLR